MINIDKEEYELIEMQDKCNDIIDQVLDYYKKNPKQCNDLLEEMVSIKEELNEITKEIDDIKNEIYKCDI